MGHLVSKVAKNESQKCPKNANEIKVEAQTQTSEIENSCDFLKTPVMLKKFDSSSSREEYNDVRPLAAKLINSDLDPRSPTVGIYRTPIVLENLSVDNLDSPVSIYSSNMNNTDLRNIVTPEASVNVSDFEENSTENKMADNILEVIDFDSPERKSLEDFKNPITFESNHLKNKNGIKINKRQKEKINSDSKAVPSKESCALTPKDQRSRPPLINITSSNNSPNCIRHSGKLQVRSRGLIASGRENNSPLLQQIGEWDRNNTVLI